MEMRPSPIVLSSANVLPYGPRDTGIWGRAVKIVGQLIVIQASIDGVSMGLAAYFFGQTLFSSFWGLGWLALLRLVRLVTALVLAVALMVCGLGLRSRTRGVRSWTISLEIGRLGLLGWALVERIVEHGNIGPNFVMTASTFRLYVSELTNFLSLALTPLVILFVLTRRPIRATFD